jgi:hypothetical protein
LGESEDGNPHREERVEDGRLSDFHEEVEREGRAWM